MIIKLTDGDVIAAQDSLDDDGIIHIPENVWDHIVQEVQHPEQSFYNELYINVQDLTTTLPQMNPLYNTITQNGVYNLVDTDNNPDDIEIESTTTNNNQRKIVKLEKTRDGDNDVEEDDNRLSLGQIIVNVPPSTAPILIDKFKFGQNSFIFTDFNKNTSSNATNLTIQNTNGVIAIYEATEVWIITLMINRSGSSNSFAVQPNYYYMTFNLGSGYDNYIWLCNGSSNVISIVDNTNDSGYMTSYISKTNFTLLLPS